MAKMIFTEKQQELIRQCIIDIMERFESVDLKTKDFQRMSCLARAGKKESQEFIELERKYRKPTVVSFENQLSTLRYLGERKNFKCQNEK